MYRIEPLKQFEMYDVINLHQSVKYGPKGSIEKSKQDEKEKLQ